MAGRITLGYSDMWPGFDARDNWFTKLLSRHFPIELSNEPDFLIFGPYGRRWELHRGTRIFFTAENIRPDLARCDWAFSFDHIDHDRHLRLPLYVLYHDAEQLMKDPLVLPPPDQLLRRRFCNFVYSNAAATERVGFFDELETYRPIDAGGSVRNNLGYLVEDKLAFLRRYKFTIAFENALYPGYTTEKLVQPMVAMSLPIYWGNPLVALDFNPESFVVATARPFAEVVDEVRALDRDDERYLDKLSQPWFTDNHPNPWVDLDRVVDQFRRIFDSTSPPVGETKLERLRAARRRLVTTTRRTLRRT